MSLVGLEPTAPRLKVLGTERTDGPTWPVPSYFNHFRTDGKTAPTPCFPTLARCDHLYRQRTRGGPAGMDAGRSGNHPDRGREVRAEEWEPCGSHGRSGRRPPGWPSQRFRQRHSFLEDGRTHGLRGAQPGSVVVGFLDRQSSSELSRFGVRQVVPSRDVESPWRTLKGRRSWSCLAVPPVVDQTLQGPGHSSGQCGRPSRSQPSSLKLDHKDGSSIFESLPRLLATTFETMIDAWIKAAELISTAGVMRNVPRLEQIGGPPLCSKYRKPVCELANT